MRIAYGVMGYGRGHAMRTMSVLPALMAEHEVTVYAGGDAFDVLAPLFPTVRIPTIGYRYNNRGGHSLPRTFSENLAPMADLLLGGPGTEALEREMRSRGTQLIISDSEAWTHRAGARLGIPRISFDHVGIIAWCKPNFPADLWLAGQRDAIGYRTLMGEPDRVLISSFYPAEPYRDDARVVGPMLRDVVKGLKPKRGDFLLVYFNKG
ncbi:MAG: glycosyltransferase family protein, partial [Algiphilus sp.]